MAVITIARQVAALGDEIAAALAKKMGYTFVGRKETEARIVELGFPQEKLLKFDERRPKFFASLSKERDEYLYYLQRAVLESASKGNCILIGRGASIILEEAENLVPLRFVSDDKTRLARLKKEFDWDDKKAQQRIDESDANRRGFHKSFFNSENENAQHFMLTLNTARLSIDECVSLIETLVKNHVTPERDRLGKERIERMLKAQCVVNQLIFDYKLNINFLRASVDGNVITLQGVADSISIAEQAVQTAARILPSCEIRNAISVVQDFKTYQ